MGKALDTISEPTVKARHVVDVTCKYKACGMRVQMMDKPGSFVPGRKYHTMPWTFQFVMEDMEVLGQLRWYKLRCADVNGKRIKGGWLSQVVLDKMNVERIDGPAKGMLAKIGLE